MKIICTKNITASMNEVGKLVKGLGTFNSPKCYIFAEDKITLQTELEVAKSLNGGFFNIEILTFKRYISSKNTNKNLLSQEASIMAIRKILLENKDNLVCFKNLVTKSTLSKTLYELISQLESAKIETNDLLELLNNSQLNPSQTLKNKILDISLIYSKYKEYLKQSNLYDSYDYLSTMPALIDSDEDIKNSIVIVVGFSTVTKQRAEIFNALIKNAKDYTQVVVSDKSGEFYTNEVLNNLISTHNNAIVTTSDYNLNVEASTILKYLFNKSVYKKDYSPTKTENVSVYCHNSTYAEVEFLAQSITKKIRNDNLRYNDIAVAVGNLSNYSEIIKRTFLEYNIPFYIDETKLLIEHPIMTLILDYVELCRKNLSTDSVKSFVSNTLFNIDKKISDGFCNYIDKYAVTRNSIKEPFIYQENDVEVYENIRKTVIKCYNALKNSTLVSEYVSSIKYMLSEVNATSNLETINNTLKQNNEDFLCDFNEKIIDKLDGVLTEITTILQDMPTNITDFKNILISGAEACKISSIPLYVDCVYVGECKDIKLKSPEILYAIGILGDIPFTKSDTAILSDKDLILLDEYKVAIEPKIKVVNKREKENVCTSLISFKKQLIVSYPLLSNDGAINTKSDVIKYLVKIFNLNEKTQSLDKLKTIYTENYGEYIESLVVNPRLAISLSAKIKNDYLKGSTLARKTISAIYNAFNKCNLTNEIEFLDSLYSIKNENYVKSESSSLCLAGDEISATTLEGYFSCPFSNFIKNSLRLHEKEEGELKPNEIGTLLHFILEKYVERIHEVTDKQSSQKLCDELSSEAVSLPEYSRYTQKSKYSYLFEQLKKEARRVTYEVYLAYTKSSFKPYLLEASFGERQSIKGIPLHAKGGEYKVKGKVDRVDIFDNKIRIIDYKTGEISSSIENFYTGKKLQLYLYMNAFINNDLKPAGAYYFPIKDTFSDKEDASYTMKGRTIDSAEILSATDSDLSINGKSKIISVATKKDGSLYSSSETLSEQDFNSFLKYAIKISEKGIDEISSGFITPTPYKDACKYCKFGGLCGFCENEGSNYRKVTNSTQSTIISAVNSCNDKTEGENE